MQYKSPGIPSLATNLLILLVLITFILSGCSDSKDQIEEFLQDPDTAPIKSVIKTSVPLAYAASVTMRAVSGDSLPNVEVIGGVCETYPCNRLVSIYVEAGELPLEFESYGLINVIGLWSSASQAILTTVFLDMNVGSNEFGVSSIALTPVLASQSQLKIIFANININVDTTPDQINETQRSSIYQQLDTQPSQDVEVNVGMDAWIIEVDNATTPSDFADDTYLISGGSQGIDISNNNAETTQLGMLRIAMAPECNLNPVGGELLLNQVGVSNTKPVVAQAFFHFDDTCNGQAKVFVGIGNYFGATGKAYPLNLNLP